ncbi:hypothetical protein TNCV_507121 [Trichonephila clavipes]|nr:hypothetical protein TNCV_507121 [Trichonephila clavipes]
MNLGSVYSIKMVASVFSGIMVSAHWQRVFVFFILAHHLACWYGVQLDWCRPPLVRLCSTLNITCYISGVLLPVVLQFIRALQTPTFQQDNTRLHVTGKLANDTTPNLITPSEPSNHVRQPKVHGSTTPASLPSDVEASDTDCCAVEPRFESRRRNWGGTKPKHAPTCMVLKATVKDKGNISLCHDESRGLRSDIIESSGIRSNTNAP